MGIDIISVFNPPDEPKVITRADKIRSMSDVELAHLFVTPVVNSGGETMFRGMFSGIDYYHREDAEHGELVWLRKAAHNVE